MTIFERLKNWWLGTAPTPAQPAPDSVESVIIVDRTPQPVVPAAAACGCGRSDTGLCVGLHLLSDEEWAAKTASKAAPVEEPVAEPAAAAPVPEPVVEVVEPQAAPAPVPEPAVPGAAEPAPAKPKRERKPRADKPAPQPAPEVVTKKPARTSRKKDQ